MAGLYTEIPGIAFKKGSDREYFEQWESFSDHPLIRKTISGDEVIQGAELRYVIISGSGDILPECSLSVGDVVKVTSAHKGVPLSLRLEKWNYKCSPWEFKYTWTFTFKEVIL